jgi:hypothetical protein
MRWHIRTPTGYFGSAATRRAAVQAMRRWCADERFNIKLEHIGKGAWVYHGPPDARGVEAFTAYLYNASGAKVFGYDLAPMLPFEEVVSR